MKYLITENRLESMIKEYILENYDVMNVEYTTDNVYLASGPNEKGKTQYSRKIINVYIDNIKHQKKSSDVRDIKSNIWGIMEGLFGLDLYGYGSEWGLKVYQVKREEI